MGFALAFQPKDISKLFAEYREAYFAARDTEAAGTGAGASPINLFPRNLCDFLERKLVIHFSIKSYVLDPEKSEIDPPQVTPFGMECFTERSYYDKHLDPEKIPSPEDIEILKVTEEARGVFDKNLAVKFGPAIQELESLGYPGVTDPKITITTKVSTSETLKHESAVQYALSKNDDDMKLPEKTIPPPVKIKHKVYSKYFPADTKASEIERIVDEALELYFSSKSKEGMA